MSSFSAFKSLVERKGLAVLTLDAHTWSNLTSSSKRDRLTRVFDAGELSRIKAPMVCLIHIRSLIGDEIAKQLLAIITARRGVATNQSGLTFRGLAEIPIELTFGSDREIRCVSGRKVSGFLAKLENDQHSKLVADSISRFIRKKTGKTDVRLLEEKAISLAKKLFGASAGLEPIAASFRNDAETALADIESPRLLEDSVISHDAHWIEGFELLQSEMVGRSVFRRGGRQLEVITANRTPLEKLFGVDLIYFKRPLENVVLVQYKMMEKVEKGRADWVFRPNEHFRDQVRLLNRVDRSDPQQREKNEYRLNSRLTYLKFVRRDTSDARGNCILPLEHFEALENSGLLVGERGGARLLHSTIKGASLNEAAFIRLMSSGYIGGYRERAAAMKGAVEGLLAGGDRLVVAIESALESASPVNWHRS